jgi:hypothetical protein
MLDVFHQSGLTVQAHLEDSCYHLKLLFPEGEASRKRNRSMPASIAATKACAVDAPLASEERAGPGQ